MPRSWSDWHAGLGPRLLLSDFCTSLPPPLLAPCAVLFWAAACAVVSFPAPPLLAADAAHPFGPGRPAPTAPGPCLFALVGYAGFRFRPFLILAAALRVRPSPAATVCLANIPQL